MCMPDGEELVPMERNNYLSFVVHRSPLQFASRILMWPFTLICYVALARDTIPVMSKGSGTSLLPLCSHIQPSPKKCHFQ
jgi:hypothetical protein